MWTFACKRSPAQRKLTIVFFPFFLLPFTSVAESYCFTFTFTFARCTGHCDTGARTHTHRLRLTGVIWWRVWLWLALSGLALDLLDRTSVNSSEAKQH
uniref:Uncharacterized protein n=1 Tax=Anopheles darlingi TaxID=43151 RepID=A0A2M4DD01_ANODA